MFLLKVSAHGLFPGHVVVCVGTFSSLQAAPGFPRVRAVRLSWEELLAAGSAVCAGWECRVLDPTEAPQPSLGCPTVLGERGLGEKQSKEPFAVLEGGVGAEAGRAQGGEVGVVVNSQCKQLLSECTQGRPSWQAAARVPAGDSEPASLSAALQRCHGIPAHLHTHTAPPGGGKWALPFRGACSGGCQGRGELGSSACGSWLLAGCTDVFGRVLQAAQLFGDPPASPAPALHGRDSLGVSW